MNGGIFIALLPGEQVDPGGEVADQRPNISQDGGARRTHVHGVFRDGLMTLTRAVAAAHLIKDAGRSQSLWRKPLRALADGEGLMQRRHRLLGNPPGPKWTEIGGRIVADLANHRQSRERLDRELEPQGTLGEPGATVVSGLVLGDEPELTYLGLERGFADDRRHLRRQPDHLGGPGSGL